MTTDRNRRPWPRCHAVPDHGCRPRSAPSPAGGRDGRRSSPDRGAGRPVAGGSPGHAGGAGRLVGGRTSRPRSLAGPWCGTAGRRAETTTAVVGRTGRTSAAAVAGRAGRRSSPSRTGPRPRLVTGRPAGGPGSWPIVVGPGRATGGRPGASAIVVRSRGAAAAAVSTREASGAAIVPGPGGTATVGVASRPSDCRSCGRRVGPGPGGGCRRRGRGAAVAGRRHRRGPDPVRHQRAAGNRDAGCHRPPADDLPVGRADDPGRRSAPVPAADGRAPRPAPDPAPPARAADGRALPVGRGDRSVPGWGRLRGSSSGGGRRVTMVCRLPAVPSNPEREKGSPRGEPSSEKFRRRPTLPGGLPPSTIGAGGLNFRVRHGNGCDSTAIATGNLLSTGSLPRT